MVLVVSRIYILFDGSLWCVVIGELQLGSSLGSLRLGVLEG